MGGWGMKKKFNICTAKKPCKVDSQKVYNLVCFLNESVNNQFERAFAATCASRCWTSWCPRPMRDMRRPPSAPRLPRRKLVASPFSHIGVAWRPMANDLRWTPLLFQQMMAKHWMVGGGKIARILKYLCFETKKSLHITERFFGGWPGLQFFLPSRRRRAGNIKVVVVAWWMLF